MAQKKTQQKQIWLGAAEERLASLCNNFIARAEDHDVLPTKKQKDSVIAFLKQVNHVNAPKMGTTVNAEITLVWEMAGDKYKAYVERDGSIICLHNKEEVQQSEFLSVVARVPA
jgi:hypothetical protein